jgi:hypothetical protein
MPSESDNLLSSGTDNAQPSDALDNPANLKFWEPGDEEPDNPEPEPSEAETDSETDETEEDGQESDSQETADEETETEDETAEADDQDDILITVEGKQLPVKEVKAGYLRQADYTRKAQDLGNQRRSLDALSARVSQSVDAIATFLTKQLPEEPNAQLAMTNPTLFIQQKAIHDAAMSELNNVLAAAGDVKGVAKSLTAEQHQEVLNFETARLIEAFPSTKTPEGKKKFFDNASAAARELGYSDEEIKQVADHRMFKLAHYARIGMQAEAARAKANTKVASVPPVTPQKRPQGQTATQARSNQDAVKKLKRTGSIHDAMKIDFD